MSIRHYDRKNHELIKEKDSSPRAYSLPAPKGPLKYEFETMCFGEMTRVEDDGQAMITSVGAEEDENFFIRIHSWDESPTREHKDFKRLVGRKVRITIETLD